MNKIKQNKITFLLILIAIVITFVVTIIIYHIMWLLVGFGGGLLAPPGKHKYFNYSQ